MSDIQKRGPGRPKSDPFAFVPGDWKDAVDGSTPQQINDKIAHIAKQADALRVARKEDADLAERKEQVKVASEPYVEGAKRFQQMIAYGRQVLGDKGAE